MTATNGGKKMKISKETIVKISLISAVVIGLTGFIVIKVYKFKKAQAENVSIIEDPNIKGKTEYEEMTETDRNSLVAKLDVKEEKKDSVDVKKEVTPPKATVRSIKVESKEQKEKESEVQEKLFERVDKIEEAKKPVTRTPVPAQPVVEKKEENVRFNFVIVKDDERVSERVSEKEVGRSGAKEQVTLYKAKVYGQQKIKTNEPVMVRNTEPFTITKPKRVTIPSGSVLFGTCRLLGNRMFINLTSATTMAGDFPIDIEVYDSDYIKGIFVREGIETGVDQSSEAVIVDASSSIPNQLAGAVVRTTARQVQRSLSKQERISILLEDGYEIMIGVPEERK